MRLNIIGKYQDLNIFEVNQNTFWRPAIKLGHPGNKRGKVKKGKAKKIYEISQQ